MNAEQISVAAAVLLSLIFSYVPKANTWFAALEGTYKRLIMLGLLVLTTGVAYGFSCLGWFGIAIVCDAKGAQDLIGALLLAIIANQSVYQISPATPAVQTAKS